MRSGVGQTRRASDEQPRRAKTPPDVIETAQLLRDCERFVVVD
jgi:hypothetical protein